MFRKSIVFHSRTSSVAYVCLELMLLLFALPSLAPAQTLDEFLQERIKQLTIARLGQRSGAAQEGSPSGSSNSTSLVDKTSVSDLFSFGINLAQFAEDDTDSANTSSATITTTMYALYAAAQGINPLDPRPYNRYSYLRNISFTYGFDDPKDRNSQSTKVFSAKLLLWNGRDPTVDRNGKHLEAITKTLTTAGTAFGKIARGAQDYLFEGSGESDKIEFINRISSQWAVYQKTLGDVELNEIDGIILSELDAFNVLDSTITHAVEEIRAAPQAALTVIVKKDGESTKYASIALNYESGVKTDLYLVGNVAYQEVRIGDQGRRAGGNIGMEVEWRPSDQTFGKTQSRLALSGSASATFLEGVKPEYKYQISITLPALKGLALPLSLRWTRGSLLDVANFSAHLGIALDLAKVMQ
ncbi:MAG TPA: hypothetical protein VI704_07910 [Bacteroidota bacterium]|nr:hypothetical protein [Bacteroidota bacterium]